MTANGGRAQESTRMRSPRRERRAVRDAGSRASGGAGSGSLIRRFISWWSPARIVNTFVPVLLLLLALLPLYSVYLTGGFYITVATGLVLGSTVAVLGAVYRHGVLTLTSVAVVVFFVCGAAAAPGTALAGVLPTPTTWQLMGVGIVTVWKQVLTVTPPLGTYGAVLLLPYLLAFLGSLVAVTLSLRARWFWLTLLVPALVLVAAILFGTHVPVLAGVIGVVAVVGALTWVSWRSGRLELHRVLAIVIVLAVAALGGTGASMAVAPQNPRVVLRDYVEPPPDPQDLPSPLAGFRTYADDLSAEDLFTVTGLPEGGAQLRLAALDTYDGTVWNVTGAATPGTGVFRRIGDRIEVEIPPQAYTLDVSVGTYQDVWVLNAGGTADVTFTGPGSPELTESLYYNTVTDTGLVTAGLTEGDVFEVVADPAAQEEPADVTELRVTSLQLPEPRGVPDTVGSLAGRYSDGADSPYAQIEAVAEALRNGGFFSHGLEGEVPSRAGHGAARLAQMLEADELVGDEEQYAAVMALMVRSLGYPARVVVGFDVEDAGTVTLTGDDVVAWVEVPFDGVGWVPFFPTPPEDQIPQVEEPDPVDKPQPQVLQPPPPPQDRPDVPPQDRDDADVDSEGMDKGSVPNPWVWVAGASTLPVLVFGVPLLLLAVIKAIRRSRRRSKGTAHQRVAGGWDEVQDQVLDLGVIVPPGRTRRESAQAMAGQFPESGVLLLADRADEAVFAPSDPAEEHVHHYWGHVRRTVQRVRHSVGWKARLRAAFSWRSLRRRA
ncbi:transglutaminase-like domain-containing protein [Ruania rhizosphaerae]|uniref:transglutaminase-like domain-containing protein n=1 Tax=Ruania rhizosphaerae TaxID=1840413 RepID=UPI001359490F|nr:transglutaminase domain-containing protein [Ruania rhizosphaerae]